MDSTNTVEQFNQEVEQLRRRLDNLRSQAQLSTLRDEIVRLAMLAVHLRPRLIDIRANRYPFDNSLEQQAAALEKEWHMLQPLIQGQLEGDSAGLQVALRSLELQLPQLSPLTGNPSSRDAALARMKAEAATLERKAETAENNLKNQLEPLKKDLEQLEDCLKRIEWTVEQLDEGSFALQPAEAGIMAVKARWLKEGKETPKGVLFLTNQRLVFEQKEEIATKKVLFITTAKEKIQQPLLLTPLAQILDAAAEKKGLFGHEDHLAVSFAAGSPLAAAHFHLDGQDCGQWKQLISKARNGGFEQDRVDIPQG
jgi:predicted  nucleic acid-binding Zn-ribbon protein